MVNYDYTGVTLTRDVIITVNRKDISSGVTISAVWPTLIYSGLAQTPTPTSVTFDGVSVTATADYTLGSWANNTKAGTNTASVTFTGAGNYTGDQVVNFTINRADCTYTVAAQNIKQGSQISAINALTTGRGVNGENVGGTLTWHESAADATSGTNALAADNAAQFTGPIDSTKTLYWRFVVNPAASNYLATAKTGSTVFTVVEGDPQEITFPSDTATATYGDTPSIIQSLQNCMELHRLTKSNPNQRFPPAASAA